MQPFESPKELWAFLIQPGAIIHNPFENITLRLNNKGFPESLVKSKVDTWTPHQTPVIWKNWEKG